MDAAIEQLNHNSTWLMIGNVPKDFPDGGLSSQQKAEQYMNSTVDSLQIDFPNMLPVVGKYLFVNHNVCLYVHE